ncbi:MAG: hypothetical protein GX868_01870, partial [Actinobacteria bacterium]|nr:hypothetical protein [Actinomycetota bacterium]
TIETTLNELPNPVDVCGRLITLANIGGGRDNITVVVADVVDAGVAGGTLPMVGRPIDRADQIAAVGSGGTVVTEERPTLIEPEGLAAQPDPTRAVAPTATEPVAAAGAATAKKRRFTWRTLVFVLAVLVVFGAALFATDWFYKNTFSVAEDDGNVVIWRGPRDSNLLWWSPEIVNPDENLKVALLPRAARDEVQAGKDMDSLAEARVYVNRLRDLTTTTTTTTTIPPPETVAPETVPLDTAPLDTVAPDPAAAPGAVVPQ